MISVAIATLGRPEHASRCVESLLAGERTPDEIVVVDQSTGSETERALERLSPAPLRYFRESSVGASTARNRAVEAARGDYVALLDDDCEVPSSWLVALEDELDRLRAPDVLYGAIRAPDGSTDRKGLEVSTFTPSEARVWTSFVHPARLGYAGHMVVRRSVFLEHGGFDVLLGPGTPLLGAEDMDLNYRLLKSGARAATTPAIWMVHHQWRDPEALPRLLRGYNLGHSAFCMKHMLRGDLRPLRLIAVQVGGDMRMLASAVRRRSPFRGRVAAARTAGTWRGLLEGWRTFHQ